MALQESLEEAARVEHDFAVVAASGATSSSTPQTSNHVTVASTADQASLVGFDFDSNLADICMACNATYADYAMRTKWSLSAAPKIRKIANCEAITGFQSMGIQSSGVWKVGSRSHAPGTSDQANSKGQMAAFHQ